MATNTPTPTPSKLQTILQIIQLALAGLQAVPITSIEASLASTFLGIFQNASSLYQAESGQPFDVTKIPFEAPVP